MSNEQRLQQQIINLTHEVKYLNQAMLQLTALLLNQEAEPPLLEGVLDKLGKQSERLSSIKPPENR